MKVTRTREVFTYSELSPAAQDRAIDTLTAEAWDVMDSDMVTEALNGEVIRLATGDSDGCVSTKQTLDRLGIRIYWQVAYMQSDHAYLDGTITCSDWPAFGWPDRVTQVGLTTRRDSCTVSHIYTTDDDGDEWREDNGSLIKECDALVQGLCRTLYRYARSECDHYTSAAACLERIDGWLPRRFLADGTFAPSEYWQD